MRAPVEWCDTLHGGNYVCVIFLLFLYMFCNLLWINDKGKERRSVTQSVAIRSRLCWRHSDDLFVLAWNHTRDWGRDFPRDWKWRMEGRSERRQRDQLTEQERRDQSAWDSCPENATVGRRRQEKMEAEQRRKSTEVRNATTEAGLTNARICQHC